MPLLPLHIVTSVSVAWDEAIFLAVPATVALGVGLEKLRLRRTANSDGAGTEASAPAGGSPLNGRSVARRARTRPRRR